MNIITRIKKALAAHKPKPPPKYRLKPMDDGRHSPERWHEDVGIYLHETAVNSEAEAREVIANLERPIISLEDKP